MDAQRQASRVQVQARREAQITAARSTRKQRQILIASAAVILVLLVGGGLFFWYSYTHPGESYPEMANRIHLKAATDSHVPYSTDPPTSGPHVSAPAEFRVYDTAQPKEAIVHNLEDAGVDVLYRPDLPQAEVDKLKALVQSYDSNYIMMHSAAGDSVRINKHVLMMPYPGLSDPIIFTAWTRLQRFQTFDESAMRHFIDMYRGIDHHQGPQG